MKNLPKCGIEMHAYLALKKQEKKKQEEVDRKLEEIYMNDLLNDIADVFKVDIAFVKNGDKQQLTVLIRQFFCYIARKKKNCQHNHMAPVIGRQNHSTCIHLIKKTEALFAIRDSNFLDLWNHYLRNSKLYTPNDFQ
jgi:chromosomal replication initiation ATPase DnaA